MEPVELSDTLGITDVLDSLKASNLLSPQELASAVGIAERTGADGVLLSRELVDAGILTPYQAMAISRRQFAELRIGNYDILGRLGAGGMGTVYKGRHRRMKRVVALKVLPHNLASDESLVRRFQSEVETIARLSHPNIVMAYDADEAEAGPFLVMEFVNGLDLASLVQKAGPLTVSVAVDCILQAARGLEYAHRQRIIHRDIKPANLLRDAQGMIKVADLGLARFTSLSNAPSTGSITQPGSVVGTVDYMSPEQAFDSAHLDHRTDIYSLGGTLHYLLLGRPPYQGQSLMETLMRHRESPIPSLAAGRGDVPAALDAIFRRMMAKTSAERYASMTEVIEALEAVESSMGAGATAVVPGLPVFAPSPAAAPSTGEIQNAATIVTDSPTEVPLPKGSRTPAAPGSKPPKVKVLLVEPSRTQSHIIRSYLQEQGFPDVAALASGQETLEAVRTDRPDGIICALHLSDMTGVQLAERIGAECRSAPGFVLISSEGDGAEAAALATYGKGVVLRKPFTPEQLAEALTRVLDISSQANAERRQPHVLIVDDSVAARRHIQGVLAAMGVKQFTEAADGAQAVAAVARARFDLIVTDYNMPFMDGRGLVGYLKQNPATASVPIVMVTTEADPGKLETLRQLGVAAICDKSFRPEMVQKIVHQLLSAP